MKPLNMSRVLGTIISVLLFTTATMAAAGQMDASKMSWDIRPQSLKSALETYQQISGLNLAYSDNLVEGKTTRGVQGNHTREQTLEKVLDNTGLTYVVTSKGTVILKVKKSEAAQEENLPSDETAGNKAKKTEPQQAHMEMQVVTVTANKTEENIQDVPMSITAFNELIMDDKNITSISELSNFVPNLTINDQGISSSARPAMRGVLAELGSAEVSTGIFIDGVPVLTKAGYGDPLQDIERVEVLRGPQGTLYGKGTSAGAINIITRQPDNNYRGKVSVDVGEDNKKEIALNLSGPIIQDKLFFGLSGQSYAKDGFIDNGYTGDQADDRAHWYGKGKLRWTPTDDLDVSLIFSYLQYDNGGTTMGLSEDSAATLGLTASGDRKVYSDLDTQDKTKIEAQALKVSYDLNDTLTLTSITTHRFLKNDGAIDFDFNPVEQTHATGASENDKISQELRLSSNAEKMRWVAGIYYDKDDNTDDRTWNSYVMKKDLGAEAYALFGQLRYALTPKIGVTGGLRYETQNRDMQNYNNGKSFEDTWDDIAPKFSVDYAITEQVMGYATVAKGFRAGGFNSSSTDSKYDTYDSEELWSYEIGAKSQLLENRLIITGSLFYMDIDDMQVSESLADAPWGYVTNVGTAVSYGAELEVQAKITPQFTITANVGYTHVEYEEYKDDSGDYSDNKIPNVPDYTFAIGGQYRAGNGLYAGVDLVGVGKTYIERTNTYKRDAYQLINAKIGYETENWDIYLYGKNIFDEDYSKVGTSYIYYSQPRELGVKLTYRF
ncbi:TonB-dependent receptor [uncultured Desulfobacter sp.]|uniref:TonB-dependent receptor n=1 Tax=uncultured Desulfobacter sp. TaxID=240139 RepID=UPI0029F4995C|nr:TonB-dependent receptor [uncultured Desulfobacter sp.]